MPSTPISLLFTLSLAIGLSGCSLFTKKKEEASRPATPLDQPRPADKGSDSADSSEPPPTEQTVPSTPPGQDWSFGGATGPEHWGDIKPEYATCKTGQEQSPVDLIFKKPLKGGKITTNYGKTPARIIDNGNTILITFDPGNSVNIRGERFELLQAQFKSSSEHTIAGNKLPLELQLLHRSESGQMAILSVIMIEGPAHSMIESLWQNVPIQKGMEKDLNFQINPEDLLPTIRTYYHYKGSLTTPPCTEGVNWNVFNTPVTLSKEQIVMFRKLYQNNSRPVQPLNQRKTVNYK